MDAATSCYHPLQSEQSRRREEEIAPGGTLVQVGRQLGGAVGRELDDAAAGRVGLALHRTFGVCYGIVAAALVRSGRRPLAAGLAVGTAAFVLVDEGTSISELTAYPVESHLRGVVGQLTWGLTAGLLLALVERG